MAHIRDLIYFDFDKAASLLSQIEGGLPQSVQETSENTSDNRNVRRYELPFFKPEFGGVSAEKQIQMQTRILHHDLLGRIETHLLNGTSGIDVNETLIKLSDDVHAIHSRLAQCAYVRATGWSILEDFEKLKLIAKNFNDLIDFIGKCSLKALTQQPAYLKIVQELEAAKGKAAAIKDRNKRDRELRRVKELEQSFSETLKSATGLQRLDGWLLEGIQFFIDLFMPNRVLLSVFPFEDLPGFQILANLKRECFVDGNLDTVIQAYGNRPNVKLTTMGLITSVPPKLGLQFDPFHNTGGPDEGATTRSDEETFELAFRRIFRSFEEFHKFISYSRWPSITIYPIALYRKVGGTDDLPESDADS